MPLAEATLNEEITVCWKGDQIWEVFLSDVHQRFNIDIVIPTYSIDVALDFIYIRT